MMFDVEYWLWYFVDVYEIFVEVEGIGVFGVWC